MINDYVARLLAKSKCKKCYGRGFLELSQNLHGFIRKELKYCNCVLNQPKQLVQELKLAKQRENALASSVDSNG